jgi:tetratricopeptide (TPR) repeat protein
MDNTNKVEMGFVQRRLPWIVGAAMLVAYLVTLSRWATPASVELLAKISGWDWRPDVVAPLHVLLRSPVRWLPAGAQLFTLNLIEAVFAAGALALLARSVSLLPYDRTKEQRQLERSDYSLLTLPAAWLPPVFAALVCGLQLTFWENAVASNGRMLDLLLFAYLVRCLLEFRLDQNERWLKKLACVYGLATVNNYALAGFLPAFLVALAWIKGMAFFNWRFLLRMFGWGCLGLSLYLLMPLVASIRQSQDYSFWQLLSDYWVLQKTMLAGAWYSRSMMLFLGITSLLPVLFIGIRWPASFGDISPIGVALTNFTMHIIHLIFMGACLYVTFDREFSPRRILLGYPYAGLPFFFLGALCVGYFAGYVLLVFGSKTDPNAKSWQRPPAIRRFAGMALVGVVWVLFVAVPGGLAWKNFPLLHASSGSALSQHAALQADSLPAKPAIVLSDDPRRLYALQAELQSRSPQVGHILVEAGSLDESAYHRFLARRHGARLALLATNYLAGSKVDSPSVNFFLANLSQSLDLYYLHPSFGYFFEAFYLKPYRAVYQMKPFMTNVISAPVLTAAELKAQDDFWRSLTSGELAALHKPQPAVTAGKARQAAPDQWGVNGVFRAIYSRALNHFGVEAQRGGDFKLAGSAFDLALKLNDRNPTAFINQEYNRRVQAGDRASQPPSSNVVERIKYYGKAYGPLLNDNGPPDEPSACFVLAQHFHESMLYRQAAQWLERSLYFEPTNINRRIFLISECLHLGLPDNSLALIADLRARPPVPLTTEDQIDLTRAEAWAHYSKRDLATAERLLRATQQRYPREATPFSTLADIYMAAGMVTNALAVYESQLKAQPDDFSALVNLAAFLIRSGRYADALPYLERAMKVKPNDPSALFNRAICQLNLAQSTAGAVNAANLDAALADFLQLSVVAPKAYSAFWGIGECYRLKKNKNEALRFYERFLKEAPPNDPDLPLARQRIQLLKSGKF